VVERYCLDRKLREALREAGMHGDEAFRGMAFAKALLPRLGGRRAPPSGGEPRETLRDLSARLVSEGSADEELRSLLGVNVFDGVTWFNKERFEEAAALAALFAAETRALDVPGPRAAAGARKEWLEAAILPSRLALGLVEAARKAGYRLEGLAEELGAEAPREE
jgi:hypothetical protein